MARKPTGSSAEPGPSSVHTPSTVGNFLPSNHSGTPATSTKMGAPVAATGKRSPSSRLPLGRKAAPSMLNA